MSIDIRLPNITAPTDAGKLQQLQGYLHQLVEQLNWALNTIDVGGTETTKQTAASSSTSTQKDDPISEFNSIKGLIIKSADIVNAYYDEITTLIDKNNLYAASSDFGDFVEKTNYTLYADGTGLTQQVENVQQIFDEEGNIKKELLVNGKIYSGIIEYAKEGEAVVGIEIGQTTTDETGGQVFSKFARFTANALEFYTAVNPDDPIASISGQRLYITNAEVKYKFKQGGYEDEVTDQGIVTRWVGGE